MKSQLNWKGGTTTTMVGGWRGGATTTNSGKGSAMRYYQDHADMIANAIVPAAEVERLLAKRRCRVCKWEFQGCCFLILPLRPITFVWYL